MKTKIMLATMVTLMLFTSLAAQPPAMKLTRVEEQMNEIDRKILLKRYETVSPLWFEIKVMPLGSKKITRGDVLMSLTMMVAACSVCA